MLRRKAAPVNLDRIDFEILRLLQNNARIMNKELSSAVGLAPSSCHERIKRLWSEGVITGTQALVAPEKLGYALCAVIFVNISKDGQLAIDELMDELVSIPEVQHIHLVTGRYDLIINVIARDMDHLKTVAYKFLTGRKEISRYETSISYDSRKKTMVPTS